jgi:hypothetical protein
MDKYVKNKVEKQVKGGLSEDEQKESINKGNKAEK